VNRERRATVFNIQHFSVRDGPGIRTVVFFKGCPLSCIWCANPESQKSSPELLFSPEKCIDCGRCDTGCYSGARTISGEEMTSAEIEHEVFKDLTFYETSGGGVTFSGGEPLLWPEIVSAVAGTCREKGVHTTIETCGHVPWENFEQVIERIDLFYFDLKCADKELHRLYTGVDNTLITENLFRLAAHAKVVIRIPVIPSLNDSELLMQQTGKLLSKLSTHIEEIHLLPFHNFGEVKYEQLNRAYEAANITVPGREYMMQRKEWLQKEGLSDVGFHIYA
jgi:pyruvate formate lyase activating enzyme